jgi:transmembrane secretion effector
LPSRRASYGKLQTPILFSQRDNGKEDGSGTHKNLEPTLGTALAMVLFALARDAPTALAGSVVAGASWIAVLASLNVSVQVALPDWVRGRGLAIFVTGFGCLTLGSTVWGQVAGMVDLPAAHVMAALGALVAIPLTWRWKLQTGAGLDLTPSLHWPAPIVAHEELFLAALEKLARERRRDGAYAWECSRMTAAEGRMVENFLVESWLEHLCQNERVTNADRVQQEAVPRFQVEGTPKITHLIAAELHPAETKSN